MLSLIQAQVVTAHGWLTEGQFADIVAISQMTPGPIGINCATFIGYEVLHSAGAPWAVCFLGSLSATLALALPSFMIVLTLARFYEKVAGNKAFQGFMGYMKPAVAGLIGAAAIALTINTCWSGIPLLSAPTFSIIRENFPDTASWMLFGLAAIAAFSRRIHPIAIIVAGGIAGLILY